MQEKEKWITADDLGGGYFIDIMHHVRKVKRPSDNAFHKRPDAEVYFSVERADKIPELSELCKGDRNLYGYMKQTETTLAIFDRLIQERRYNASINFIVLKGFVNVVFEDGVYISEVIYRMKTYEFIQWVRRINIVPTRGVNTVPQKQMTVQAEKADANSDRKSYLVKKAAEITGSLKNVEAVRIYFSVPRGKGDTADRMSVDFPDDKDGNAQVSELYLFSEEKQQWERCLKNTIWEPA